MLNFKNFI